MWGGLSACSLLSAGFFRYDRIVHRMPDVNSPFDEPRRHFYFSDDGITDKIVESRRLSSYFFPIPPSRKRSGKEQLVLETEWTRDRQQENKFINDIRNAVANPLLKQTEFPKGWDEEKIRRVLNHYEGQTDKQAAAEDEAGVAPAETVMNVPRDLIPKVRELIAKHQG